MFGISEFFKKFQNSYTKEVYIRTAIKDSITKHTGAVVPLSAITFRSGAVILDGVSPSLKSVIYIKKQTILKEIALKQDIRVVTDIW